MLDDAAFAEHALMQDPAFAAALRICGQNPLHLRGGQLVLQRRIAGIRIAMLPRLAPPPDLDQMLAAPGLHRTPLILSPEARCPLPRSIALRRPQSTAHLSLDGGKEACRARLHPKWRNQLAKAEKQGTKVTIKRLPPDPTHPVLLAEQAQGKSRGYRNWPATLTAAFAAAASDQTCLLQAHKDGEIIAHMLFLIHGSRATYHIGHTEAAGKSVYAHNLLMWRGLRRLAREGVRSLDLGMLSDATPDLNRFKLRTGATRRETGGTHLYWRPFARR